MMISNRIRNIRSFSQYVFNKNTYKHELNPLYEYNKLSTFECFMYYPITSTKEFFKILFSKMKK